MDKKQECYPLPRFPNISSMYETQKLFFFYIPRKLPPMKTFTGQKTVTAGSSIQLLLNCCQEIPLINSLHCRTLNIFFYCISRGILNIWWYFKISNILFPYSAIFSRNPYDVPRYPSWETLCWSMTISVFLRTCTPLIIKY